MKLISTEHGQSVQLFIPDEVRAPSGAYLPGVLRAIAERYAFALQPTNLETVMKEGAKYREGRFVESGKTIEIKDLGFYTDGVIVGTYNTDDSDVVLSDIIVWATEQFGLREPVTKFPRTYTSSVVVEFAADLDLALEAFSQLRQNVSSAIRESYGRDVEIKASQVTFAADPTTLPQHTRFNFIIERRAGRPYTENRYFSGAPLSTRKHIELLRELEQRWI